MEDNKMTKSKIYMIIGICVLVLALGGSTYAYYAASATGNIGGTTAGGGITMTVTQESISTGALIPIDMTTDMLTKAAKGWNTSTQNVGTGWDADRACIDKNGSTVCKIYKVRINNTSTINLNVNATVTLDKTNTQNIDCVKMASNISVTNENSCTGANTLENNTAIPAGGHIEDYVMVFIKNTNTPQTDSGEFTGTITVTSTAGGELKARFGADTLTAAQYLSNLSDLVSDGYGNKRYRGMNVNNC